ncbi:MAG: DNA polymerase Y family protein [Aquabacterium sp.]
MLHWMALLPGTLPALTATSEGPAASEDADALAEALCAHGHMATLGADHLAWWGLQFTPRVARLEEAVVLEIQASERLFGGAHVLRQRIADEAARLGILAWAHAGSAHGALALARFARMLHEERASRTPARPATPPCTHTDGKDGDAQAPDCDGTAPDARLAWQLDRLPLQVLAGVEAHMPTLARLGCRTLGDVRALPRGGLSRRFGSDMLATLDQAYGLRPEAFDWITLPATFEARLELPGRVETAPALLFAAQRLLQQLCAWLAGRQAGITAFTLHWLHDWHRRDTSREGQWRVRMASPTRDLQRLTRLLAEHLQRIELAAPVGDIRLQADEIEPLPLDSLTLFQEHDADRLGADPQALLTPAAQRAQREALLALLDRLSVRLGPQRVLNACIQPDHRLECAQVWLPAIPSHPRPNASLTGPARHASGAGSNTASTAPFSQRVADVPQPCWMLPEPMPLALCNDGPGLKEHPVYQGRLSLLAGPHRIEAGWWDTRADQPLVTRDYYLASSEKAGLLWIFRTRHAPDDARSPWYLHGFFA